MLFEDTGFALANTQSFVLRTSFDVINFLKERFLSPHLVQLDVRFIGMEQEVPV